jgi:CRP-like cAMP-binding protein
MNNTLTKTVFFPKGHFLRRPGENSKCIYFVEKGVIREFLTSHSGDEITTQMIAEKAYLYCSSKSTKQGYQILESCVLRLLNKDEGGTQMLQSVLEETLHRLELRSEILKLKCPTERLEMFESIYPGICNRVASYHVASLLNITPQTLSRVRRIRSLRRRCSD